MVNVSNGSESADKLTEAPTHPPLNLDWPFDRADLYKIALQFFKDNESKAFYPSYDQRNTLVAYSLQEKYGKFNSEKAIPLGALDFVGHDRRNAWISLNDLSKSDAQQNFIELLDTLCPLFRPYVIAVKYDLDEKERKRKEQEEVELKKQQELEEKNMEEQQRKLQEEKQKQFEEQKRMIQEILNRQTIHQFATYAKQQYPNNLELQEQLIKQLQEQHFQQYVQQMMENSSELFDRNNDVVTTLSQNGDGGEMIANQVEKLSLNNNHNNTEHIEHEEPSKYVLEEQTTFDEDEEESEEEHEQQKTLGQASMWTRKDIATFKDSIQAEGGHGVIKVGHGEIATIRVPTHHNGSCLFWEFATDHYDIGFGLLFEWTSMPDNQVSVHISDSEDDDEEEEEGAVNTTSNDLEKGTNRVFTVKSLKNGDNRLPVSVIIPIYRRDSHEEVFAGSHIYPGKGVYLLKFDNSYSLWRSKTLYYRVYYTKEP